MISGANSLWKRGFGNPPPETIITVGFDLVNALHFMNECEYAGQVSNGYGVKNEEATARLDMYICRQPRQPWNEMWANLQWFQ